MKAALRLNDLKVGEYFLQQILDIQIKNGDDMAFETARYLGRKLRRKDVTIMHYAAVSRGAHSVAVVTASLLGRDLIGAEVDHIADMLREQGKYGLAHDFCQKYNGNLERLRKRRKRSFLRSVATNAKLWRTLEEEFKGVQATIRGSINLGDQERLHLLCALLRKQVREGKLFIARSIADEIFKIVAVREPWARAFFLFFYCV